MKDKAIPAVVETRVWLLITGHGSWRRLREQGEWAFPDKALGKARLIKPGDLGVVYLTQDGGDSSLGGVIRFGEGLQQITPKTFFDIEYPHRIPIEVVRAPADPVPIRPLIPELEFIKNKQNWGLYFQGHPVRPLAENDANRFLRALRVG